MAAIAKEAGYTAPTLYTYFKGKADIFHELVDLVLRTIAEVYEEHEPAGMTFEQKLELLILRQFKVIDDLSDAFAFFLTLPARGETGPADARKRKRQQTDLLSLRQQMIQWLSTNLQDSEFVDLNVNLVEVFISGTMQGFVSRWAEGDRSEHLSKKISIVIPLVIGGLEGLAKRQA